MPIMHPVVTNRMCGRPRRVPTITMLGVHTLISTGTSMSGMGEIMRSMIGTMASSRSRSCPIFSSSIERGAAGAIDVSHDVLHLRKRPVTFGTVIGE
jgi:hypothetical protein